MSTSASTPPPAHPLSTDSALRRRLIALARRWLSDTAAAEDLIQETYLRTAQSPLPGDGVAWLSTVLHHLCIDHQRRHRRYQAILALPPTPTPGEYGPAQQAEQGQRVEAALARLVAQLPAADVAAVLLREAFEFEHAELAELLARSEAATRQHLHRLLQRLRRPPTTNEASDAEDRTGLLRVCRQALRQQDPTALIALLRAARPQRIGASRPTRAMLVVPAAAPARPQPARAQLLQADGMLALLVHLDGGLLALLPLGEATPAPA